MTVAFGAGVEMVNVPLTILPDDIVEEEEVLVMTLSSPATGEALGDLYKATAMIFDDDAYYSIEKAIYHSTESTLILTINILRFGYTGRAGTVQLSTSDVCAVSGLDYTAQTNTLVSFDAGDKSQPVTLGILNDKIVEGNEWFRFSLSNPTQGELGVIRCARVNIKDDDCLISFGDDIYHVLEDTEMAMITVKRGAYIEKEAQIGNYIVTTVGLSAEENVDFTDVTRTIVFGVGETSVTFEVPIRNDDIVEQTESFEIRFSNMLGGQIGYPATAVVLIENEDVTYCFAESAYTVVEEERKVTIEVIRKGYKGRATSIEFTTERDTALSGQDFTNIRSLTVPFSIDQSAAKVDVTITDDGNYELTEHFNVLLTSSVVDELSVPSLAVVTIISDDVECDRPCQNGGICINPDECLCPKQFTGTNCENDVDECTLPNDCTDPLLTCVNTNGSYHCECRNPRFQLTGGTCIDVGCPLDYCLNGGVCVDSTTSASGYSCVCAIGYSGQTCDVYEFDNPTPTNRDGTLSAGEIGAIAVAGLVAILSLLLACQCCLYFSRMTNQRYDTNP
ncbi:extracellular matrix protein 3-like [Amphiura filiformis]|uniref:extracellular matrix protein 3-like n=1 Tax=Amphiura filiformis TaxID=82378 RepID=UPI003B21CD96